MLSMGKSCVKDTAVDGLSSRREATLWYMSERQYHQTIDDGPGRVGESCDLQA